MQKPLGRSSQKLPPARLRLFSSTLHNPSQLTFTNHLSTNPCARLPVQEQKQSLCLHCSSLSMLTLLRHRKILDRDPNSGQEDHSVAGHEHNVDGNEAAQVEGKKSKGSA